jgi:hypothetical protein
MYDGGQIVAKRLRHSDVMTAQRSFKRLAENEAADM